MEDGTLLLSCKLGMLTNDTLDDSDIECTDNLITARDNAVKYMMKRDSHNNGRERESWSPFWTSGGGIKNDGPRAAGQE